MKHIACASWCSSCALASLEAACSFTRGFSTMREKAPLPFAVSTITPAAFRQRVNDLYGAMRDALQRGDWPAFGKAYDDLGRLLKLPTAK